MPMIFINKRKSNINLLWLVSYSQLFSETNFNSQVAT